MNIQESVFQLFYIPRHYKRMISVAVDFLLLCFAFFVALGLLNLPLPDLRTWGIIALTAALTQLLLMVSSFYSSVTRYLHIKTLMTLVIAALFAQLVFKVVTLWIAINTETELYPTFWSSEMVVTAMTICVMLGGIRMVVFSFFSHYINRQKESVIIYGAGRSGQQLALSLLNGGQYFPVAFIDDNPAQQGISIRGIKVWSFDDMAMLVERYNIDLVMLALPSISQSERQRILNELADYSLAVKSIPTLDVLVQGKTQLSDLQNIEVDELLGRDPVEPDQELMTLNINHKSVMITGAGGSIGSELARQIVNLAPQKVVLFESSEFALYQISAELKQRVPNVTVLSILGSVQDENRLKRVMELYRVHTVFHTAAYKHVPMVESNSIAGVVNNVKGTLLTAQAAADVGVEKFVLISTDKAVRPTNMMGASKRLAELVLQAMNERHPGTC
ncbi:MAG: polysaccharide biosynthesis protein, partial [Pseudomonadota bacterium]